jgi:hypothetical protein
VYFSLAFVRVRSGFTVLAYPAIDRSAKVYSGGTPLLRDITNESNINSKPKPSDGAFATRGFGCRCFLRSQPRRRLGLGHPLGRDPLRTDEFCWRSGFNLHPRAGGRPRRAECIRPILPVSIHAPARGATGHVSFEFVGPEARQAHRKASGETVCVATGRVFGGYLC